MARVMAAGAPCARRGPTAPAAAPAAPRGRARTPVLTAVRRARTSSAPHRPARLDLVHEAGEAHALSPRAPAPRPAGRWPASRPPPRPPSASSPRLTIRRAADGTSSRPRPWLMRSATRRRSASRESSGTSTARRSTASSMRAATWPFGAIPRHERVQLGREGVPRRRGRPRLEREEVVPVRPRDDRALHRHEAVFPGGADQAAAPAAQLHVGPRLPPSARACAGGAPGGARRGGRRGRPSAAGARRPRRRRRPRPRAGRGAGASRGARRRGCRRAGPPIRPAARRRGRPAALRRGGRASAWRWTSAIARRFAMYGRSTAHRPARTPTTTAIPTRPSTRLRDAASHGRSVREDAAAGGAGALPSKAGMRIEGRRLRPVVVRRRRGSARGARRARRRPVRARATPGGRGRRGGGGRGERLLERPSTRARPRARPASPRAGGPRGSRPRASRDRPGRTPSRPAGEGGTGWPWISTPR